MSFILGCNYWASNAGVYMWRQFDENVVDKDFALLKEHGVNTVRIFPLWSDFQPVSHVYDLDRTFYARTNDQPIKTRAGLDETMLLRFEKVLDLADKYNFKVVIGLITGWMSGRLFCPQILYNENLITSPKAIVWEVKFINEFIARFKHRDCIIAWEPGNECNCLTNALPNGPLAFSAEEAELWLATITNAIRATDNTRPVWSGMHGLGIENRWDLRVHGEYVDMQTTHPYPLFTPFCMLEKLTSMRAALHAAAESVYYADVSGKPCLVEEVGSLGPCVLSDEEVPKYINQSLFTSYQYATTGCLWWCGFDQDGLEFPPYDGSALERNLGLATFDGTAKPALKEMKKMCEVVSEIGALPTFEKHAVVILTDGETVWKSAYGAFCLAAQAGYSVEFMYRSQPLKDSDVYIIPCVTADVYLKFMPQLVEKIKNGAKLLLTYGGGHFPRFEELTGLRVIGREVPNKVKTFTFAGQELSVGCKANLLLRAADANVLAEEDGNVLFSENKLGKGSVYFFNAPLEGFYTESYNPCATGLHAIYKHVLAGVERAMQVDSALCCLTLHKLDEKNVVALIYNFGEEKALAYKLADGYEIKKCAYGSVENGKIYFDEPFVCVELAKK